MPRSELDRDRPSRRPARFLWALLCPIALGCEAAPAPALQSGAPPTADAAPSPAKGPAEGASAANPSGPVLSSKIKVEDGAGREVFSVKPKGDGAKLVDAAEHEIARYHMKDDKLKIKDADDKALGAVTGSAGKYHLKDAARETTLFELQRQDDGDWKLKDGREALLYKIKKREYGFEIEDANGTSLAKSKTKGNKVELRDASDKTLFSTHFTAAGALPMACLGLDKVGDLSLKVALMVRVATEAAPAPTTDPGAPKP